MVKIKYLNIIYSEIENSNFFRNKYLLIPFFQSENLTFNYVKYVKHRSINKL